MTEIPQPRGRPRESRVDHTVRRATRELLQDVGYSGFTVETVARRAGVGKAAIYRRFGSKAEMAFVATMHDAGLAAPADTRSLRGDLHAMITAGHALLADPVGREVAPAVLAEFGRDPASLARFHETFYAAELSAITELIDRAVARGELNARPDPTLVHLMVVGPVFLAVVAYRVSVDDAMINDLVDGLVAGLTVLGGEAR